ncbi:ammonium transporter [uncultured Paludibaculum sp.]|uniref:ammonium transporter n=1 Tax=uncultured Paludibaculum sp. TaxID=1765020 RepID=UPI002AAB088E|nr:ammonium transporter [uncultured Paludibaculum sp.]
MKRSLLILAATLLVALTAGAQTPTTPAAAAPPAAAVPITDADLKGVEAPKAELRAKGDPDGNITGTVADVAVSDSKKGLTISDLVNQVGQNKIGINFVWTLVAGFMVMFMQAGFAIVETGLCRAKNANHTMMMNFMVYGVGMLAYWLIGFSLQMGGVGAVGNLGGSPVLNSEFAITLFGKSFGLFGQNGFFLMHNGTYDVAVMVIFLFQMVFMDTALTIVTGSAAERWKYVAFLVSSFVLGAFIYPVFANWAWGGGWLATLGTNFGLGKGYADFAGSGVVHSVGGLMALVLAIIVGPRIGKFDRDGKPHAMPGHDIVLVLTGCFILAFGWFGFNPGSSLGASGSGNLRISSVAVNTMLAGMAGSFGAMFYMWIRYGKPDSSMSGNGLLAGLVAITAPSGFVNPVCSVIIGLIAGVLVCLSVEFVERVMKIDDPVGAISVHGANGIWGVISVGLFADGKSNYGGSWNGVTGSVTGLFYGDAGQLVAQLIGVSALIGVVFTVGFVCNLVIEAVIGQRVSAKAEMEGLDLPEVGAVGYPEFELKASAH